MSQQYGYIPARADVLWIDFDPTRGHEQANERPAVVISTTAFNHGSSRLVVVLPMTTRARGIPLHIQVQPPEGGLRSVSYILCDQIRTIDISPETGRLKDRRGALEAQTMAQIDFTVRTILGLELPE